MKKILFLFVLCLGMFSFTSPELNASNNADIETITEDVSATNYEITLDNNYSDELKGYKCTVTLTYNGEVVDTFTGYGSTVATACGNASQQAAFYVFSQGGCLFC